MTEIEHFTFRRNTFAALPTTRYNMNLCYRLHSAQFLEEPPSSADESCQVTLQTQERNVLYDLNVYIIGTLTCQE